MFNLKNLLQLILDWSEVWVVLIPLFILLVYRKRHPAVLKPVIWYLWMALLINLLADVIADLKIYLPNWLQSNNFLYNIHSVVRFFCFSYFFSSINKSAPSTLKKIIPFVFVGFIAINFSIFENFVNFQNLSGSLLSVEAYLLLVYCMQYYLLQLKQEIESISSERDFWIVTGLSIYVVVNFFIFLFYIPMITYNPALAVKMWNVHNVAYIIFCVLIAKAFYVPAGN